jgi:small subunit ribosomal protein S13e
MGRMYGRGKGISKSAIPYKRRAPRWMNIDSTQLTATIEQLAKKGLYFHF